MGAVNRVRGHGTDLWVRAQGEGPQLASLLAGSRGKCGTQTALLIEMIADLIRDYFISLFYIYTKSDRTIELIPENSIYILENGDVWCVPALFCIMGCAL